MHKLLGLDLWMNHDSILLRQSQEITNDSAMMLQMLEQPNISVGLEFNSHNWAQSRTKNLIVPSLRVARGRVSCKRLRSLLLRAMVQYQDIACTHTEV